MPKEPDLPSTERQKPLIEQVRQLALPTWREDAIEIMNAIDLRLSVIVSGPSGIGKTWFLAPTIRQEAESRGYQVHHISPSLDLGIDLQKFLERTEIADSGNLILFTYKRFDDPTRPKKLLIIDEAQVLAVINPDIVTERFSDFEQRMKDRQKTYDALKPQDINKLADLLRKFRQANVNIVLINVGKSKELSTLSKATLQKAFATVEADVALFDARRHIPVEIVTKALDTVEADDQTRNFFLDPQNKAITTPGLFPRALEYASRGGLNQLLSILKQEAYSFSSFAALPLFGHSYGGSKSDAIQLVKSIGAYDESIDHDLIPDY